MACFNAIKDIKFTEFTMNASLSLLQQYKIIQYIGAGDNASLFDFLSIFEIKANSLKNQQSFQESLYFLFAQLTGVIHGTTKYWP